MPKPVIIILILLGLLLLYSCCEYLRVKALTRISGRLVTASHPYEQHPTAANLKILVVGDSTGVGTGTSDPKYSLAGRLAQANPAADITNLSQNGLRTAGLLAQAKQLPPTKYDFTLIHIGGNDLIRLQNLQSSGDNIKQVLDILAPQSKTLAIFTTGNLGESNFFPYVSKPLFTYRAKALRNRVKTLAASYPNVTYVDLFSYPKSLPDIHGYAADQLHLDDAGYGLWYEALAKSLPAGGKIKL